MESTPKLTLEQRGKLLLIGINRPYIQNRIDPETFRALAKAYYDYEHDANLRVAILFGHGSVFSQGVDVDAYKALTESGEPLLSGNAIIDPLGRSGTHLSKPLIVVVHGDTWNMGHELCLLADIRVAAEDTRFGQDENTHGRFPGGGSTVRFMRDAGWANAMRYMLTGDHWSAADAFRMGVVQELARTQEEALQVGLAIAEKIASCAPLGIKATLESAHMVSDPYEALALSKLDSQYASLYKTYDFMEGRLAEEQGRKPDYQGK